ncbi:MAG: L-lactate permease [Deltaproteobacteria bacterium]|nr:L-lactate permease [Deltaproteobacteria bacterium]
MQWNQDYFAVGGNVFLTALCAAIPMIFLFWALAVKKMKGHLATFLALVLTMLIAILIYGMPVSTTFSATAFGAANGLLPLCWLIFNAVLLYNLIIKSGNFEIIKSSIASVSNDRRIQAILIGFCFSAFLEGTTAQGAPVAIAAAMLIGLGFPVLPAAIVCLVGNTVPVPYGPVGMPTITMANVSGIDANIVTAAVGGVMCFYSLIIPIFMLVVMSGWKSTKEVLPVCLVASVTYLIPNWFITQYMGPALPSLLSPLISLICVIVFLKFWKPATIWRFDDDAVMAKDGRSIYGAGKILYAWTPFILVTAFMFVWSTQAFKAFSKGLGLIIKMPGGWPGLNGVVYKVAPIVKAPEIYKAAFAFDMFAAIGTALLIVSVITTIVFRMKASTFARVFGDTFMQLRYAMITIICVLSIAHLSNYAGISFTLGLAFAATGALFMVFSPLIGFLGVFLTGSVTTSSALFGNLQRVTAMQLELNPLITVTASMVGAVMGKLISPQSITIATAAVGLVGREGDILSKTTKYAFILLGIGIVAMLILTYLMPWYFPLVQ